MYYLPFNPQHVYRKDPQFENRVRISNEVENALLPAHARILESFSF